MEIKHLTLDNATEHRSIAVAAFLQGRALSEAETSEIAELNIFPSEYNQGSWLGAFDSGELVGAMGVYDLKVNWDGRAAPLGAVSAVSCRADYRNQGVVSALLKEALAEMREAGQYLSALFPFSMSFYRKHGWEWVGERRVSTFPIDKIPRFDSGAFRIRLYENADAQTAIEGVYREYAKRYRGMVQRDATQFPNFWKSHLGIRDNKNAYTIVCEDKASKEPKGYFTFRYPSAPEKVFLDGFTAVSPEALRALLRAMRSYSSQFEKFSWAAPADDPLPVFLHEHDLETVLTPVYMGRVTDVLGAFSEMRISSDISGSLTIGICDPVCEWNNGKFHIKASEGRIFASRATAQPDVVMSVQTLAQVYWGCPSLSRARWAGQVCVSSEPAYQLLSRLFPPAAAFIADDF